MTFVLKSGCCWNYGRKRGCPQIQAHISKHFFWGDLPLRPIESLIRLLLLEILSISYVCKCWKKTTSIQTCCKRNKYHCKICVVDRKCAKSFLTNMCDNCFEKLPDLLLSSLCVLFNSYIGPR